MTKEGLLEKHVRIIKDVVPSTWVYNGHELPTEKIVETTYIPVSILNEARKDFPKGLWTDRNGVPDIVPYQSWFLKWFGKARARKNEYDHRWTWRETMKRRRKYT